MWHLPKRCKALLLASFLVLSLACQAQVRVLKKKDLQALLARQNDTLYVMNFWATWCKPCVAELPHFQAAMEKYKGQKVKFEFYSLDFASDLKTKVLPFISRRKLGGTHYLVDEPDYDTWLGLVSKDWQGAIPVTLVMGYKGKVRRFENRSFREGQLEALLEGLVK